MTADQGVIYVVLDHFMRHLYPRALDMERRVREGATLSTEDIEHVARQLEGMRQLGSLLARHPEHRDLAAGALDLYLQIARGASRNERAARTPTLEG